VPDECPYIVVSTSALRGETFTTIEQGFSLCSKRKKEVETTNRGAKRQAGIDMINRGLNADAVQRIWRNVTR